MEDVSEKLVKIEKMSWMALQALALKELSRIPANRRIVYEEIFGEKWPKFKHFIISLAEKDYAEISQVCKNMSVLTDLAQSEVGELATIATINQRMYRSPKIGFYQICKLLHTGRR